MKKNVLRVAMASMLMFAMVSCSDDNDPIGMGTTTATAEQVVSAANDGRWRVNSLTTNEADETENFRNFKFTFLQSGAVEVTNSGTGEMYSGTWEVVDNDADADDNSMSNDIDFNLLMDSDAPANFQGLDQAWDVTSVDATTISLKKDNANGSGTSYLVFQKA